MWYVNHCKSNSIRWDRNVHIEDDLGLFRVVVFVHHGELTLELLVADIEVNAIGIDVVKTTIIHSQITLNGWYKPSKNGVVSILVLPTFHFNILAGGFKQSLVESLVMPRGPTSLSDWLSL